MALWPRGGAKSTTAELGCVYVGDRQVRNYIWYVSSTQEKADKHVETIGATLESPSLGSHNPALAARMVGKYGNSKGWRRERLRTSSGLTIDALGLDTGARGAKVEEHRPDMMIFDDVDELHDSLAITSKKIETITKSLLPAGSNDCAVLFIQNLIAPDSIASQLADGRADFLADRIISGPFPAVEGMTVEQRDGKFWITGGAATWEGQNLEICQGQMHLWGYTSFRQEAQHEIEQQGGIWDHIEFQYCDWGQVPKLERCVVWVDPAVTSTDQSDSQGVQVDGIDESNRMYRLFSWEGIDSPEGAIRRAITKGLEFGAESVGVETDQGGDTWQTVYRWSCEQLQKESNDRWRAANSEGDPPKIKFPVFRSDKAGAGYGSKVERNQRMLADYERGMVYHVRGTHTVLDRALKRFPIKPLDLADAGFWGWNDLRGHYAEAVPDPFAGW